jgi:hypothetical protein
MTVIWERYWYLNYDYHLLYVCLLRLSTCTRRGQHLQARSLPGNAPKVSLWGFHCQGSLRPGIPSRGLPQQGLVSRELSVLLSVAICTVCTPGFAHQACPQVICLSGLSKFMALSWAWPSLAFPDFGMEHHGSANLRSWTNPQGFYFQGACSPGISTTGICPQGLLARFLPPLPLPLKSVALSFFELPRDGQVQGVNYTGSLPNRG